MLLRIFFNLSSLYTENIPDVIKVLFQDDTHTLCGQWIAREVAVVGLIIDAEGYVPAWEEEVSDVEISDEWGAVFSNIVTITELSVEE